MRAYVITRLLGEVAATVCASPDGDYSLPPVKGDGMVPFEVRADGAVTPGAVQLALALLADWFGEAERAGDVAVLRERQCRAVRYAQPFAFDHFSNADALSLVIRGEHIDRWLRAHTPVAA